MTCALARDQSSEWVDCSLKLDQPQHFLTASAVGGVILRAAAELDAAGSSWVTSKHPVQG